MPKHLEESTFMFIFAAELGNNFVETVSAEYPG